MKIKTCPRLLGFFALKIYHRVSMLSDEDDEGQLELDIHTDSQFLGKTAVISCKTSRPS